MDPSSSSSTNHHHNQHQPIQLQERDWLSCSTSTNHGVRNAEDENERVVVVVEKEHMFDKVVTPSDVGKLNRLVIPKQHAEKYFPLDTTNNTTSNSNNNSENKTGLLLNFEDRTGKSWRFRYSYWNSSQSYVMTKGWSRFVKEKQLSAGDIVSFQRAVGDDLNSKNTFFIDWRRRPPDHHHLLHHHHHHLGTAFSVHHSIPAWRSSISSGSSSITNTPTFFLRSHPHESHPHHNSLWDHSSNNNNINNINSTHLSPINGNIMSLVPYSTTHGGSRTGPPGSNSGSGSGSGSLILLRSPVPHSSLINHPPHLMMPNYPHHLSSSSWGVTNEPFQRSQRDEPIKVYDSVPVVHGVPPGPSNIQGAGRGSLRLFGVNMEYDHNNNNNSQEISIDETPTTLSLSSSSTTNFSPPQN